MEEPTVKAVESMEVLSMSFTGSYDQTSDTLDELMSWLLRAGHPYGGQPFAIYYDDPQKVDEDDLRAEVCLQITEEIEARPPVERRTLEGGDFVCVNHEGPYDDIYPLYEELFDWVGDNGYAYREEVGTREVFIKMIGDAEEDDELLTEVQVPVAKA